MQVQQRPVTVLAPVLGRRHAHWGETPPVATEETIGRLLAGAPAHNLRTL